MTEDGKWVWTKFNVIASLNTWKQHNVIFFLRDEGWSEIAGDNLLDATSPKPPPPTSRNSNSNSTSMVSNSLHPSSQSAQHSSSTTATSDNRWNKQSTFKSCNNKAIFMHPSSLPQTSSHGDRPDQTTSTSPPLLNLPKMQTHFILQFLQSRNSLLNNF